MPLLEDLLAGQTFAESVGITGDMGRAVARLAASELEAGRAGVARDLLEGLALANPHDAATWCLLAIVERKRGATLAAFVCADVASRLAPDDPQVRLVHAESRLALPATRDEGRAALRALATLPGLVGDRARALSAAVGDPVPPRGERCNLPA